MSVLKQYNPATSQWEAVVLGKQGPSGTVAVTAPLTNSGTSTAAQLGIDYSALQYGQNAIINGAFDFWQRGTSLTYAGGYPYLADRWRYAGDGSGFTRLISQQTFAPGTIPVSGFEGQFFYRFNQTVAGTGGTFSVIETTVEDVRKFAGQTITFSFWAKADTARTIQAGISYQIFGAGGSSNVFLNQPSVNITTSWARYSVTQNIPSISGKTVGTNSNLIVGFGLPNNTVQTIDIWGVQLEAGSIATPFKRASGTVQGELAACQRYYARFGGNAAYEIIAFGGNPYSSTNCQFHVKLPVTMRTVPTSLEYASLQANDNAWGATITSLSITSESGKDVAGINAGVGSGYTTNRPTRLVTNNSTAGYLAFSAEF